MYSSNPKTILDYYYTYSIEMYTLRTYYMRYIFTDPIGNSLGQNFGGFEFIEVGLSLQLLI